MISQDPHVSAAQIAETIELHNFVSFMQKNNPVVVFSRNNQLSLQAHYIKGAKRNTSKMTKETISPVQNTEAQMSQEEKPWFNHSQMIANFLAMAELK